MAHLFDVLSATEFETRAARSVPIYRGTRYRPGDIYDFLARLVWDALPENREAVFLELMKRYVHAELETERWVKINALAHAFKGDFIRLVKYLREHGIPVAVRKPADKAK